MEAWQWILNLSVCADVDVLIKSTSLLFIADIYELSFCRAVIAACDSDTAAAAAAIMHVFYLKNATSANYVIIFRSRRYIQLFWVMKVIFLQSIIYKIKS